MIWTELYRPKTLKDFIGNPQVVSALKRWMEMYWNGRAALPIAIIYGKSGVGKTTLSHCLADEFKCSVTELNASDERNVNNMKRAILLTGISGLDSRRRLTILDEADSISKSAQQLLVTKVKLIRQPIVLLVNDLDKIIFELQKISLKFELKRPNENQLLMVAREVIEKEGLKPWDLRKIVQSSKSFRDLLNNLFFDCYGENYSSGVEGTKLELIGAMLRGEIDSRQMRISPDELLRFVYQNKIRPHLREVDIWLTEAKRSGNYRLWAYAFSILELQRYEGLVHKPKFEFKSKAPKQTEKTETKMVGSSKKLHGANRVKRTTNLLSHI